MLTIILPGHSFHNKKWADDTKQNIIIDGEIIVHVWKHWKEGGNIDSGYEMDKILSIIKDRDVNFIAKSVGTWICMNLVPELKNQINKILLCGIASDPADFSEPFKLVDEHNILVIQNSKDPFMPYRKIFNSLKTINSKIRVIEKDSDTHDYFYFEDMNKFFKTESTPLL